MKRKNTTRNALLTSIISLLLCVSMLVGTTFAWFTDSVESDLNTITAGNLDVELYHSDKGVKDEKVTTSTKLFDDVTLWEPGAVAYENLQVKNEGNLALKYQMALNFANATDNGAGKTLADVLKVAVVKGGFNGDRAAAHALTYNYDLASFSLNGELEKGQESDIFGIVIYWEPTANDNEFNMNNENQSKVLSIDLGINLFATQEMHEEDSFDDTYDKDTEVFTIAEANAMLAENKDVTLINCIETNGVIQIPAGYTGKLILKDSTIASVQAAGAANITILGNVTVDASALANTSAITGTVLNINGNGNLTAIANGDHAYGIGGDQTTAITIDGVHIVDVKGGNVKATITDNNYGKNEPEGGAAIGSGKDGAVITLKNVTIDNAQGGSKAAGIGALFHTGVTVNIEGSIIKNVEGGSSSAGIGGSRMTKHESGDTQNITINITNSTINAKGGDFAAGIGSGYNTYCSDVSPAPVISVSIDEASNITAQGGLLGAGIGTGHNAIGFVGNIACDTSNVKAGSSEDPSWCCWGNPCTTAEDVGLGVLSMKNFKDLFTVVASADELKEALNSDAANINIVLANDIAIDIGTGWNMGGAETKSITIKGATPTTVLTLSSTYRSYFNMANPDGTLYLQDMVLTNAHTGTHFFDFTTQFNCDVEATNVAFQKAPLTSAVTAVFNNCTFAEPVASYSLWIMAGSDVTVNGASFNATRGIKIADEDTTDAVTTLAVKDATFNTTQKAAIVVASDMGANITLSNVNIANTVDPVHEVWVDEDYAASDAAVTVTGGEKIYEGYCVSDGLYTDAVGNYYVYNAAGLNSLKVWMDANSNKGAVWGKTYNIMADIDATDVTWTTKFMVPDSATFDGFTFNGNGHTISNLTINGQGLFTGTSCGSQSTVPATFKNITFDNVTVTGGTHHNGVIWGEAYGSITLENVSVINSKVSGGCNVGGLIGRNSESHATFKFIDCAVKNTTVEATQVADYAGASAFLGNALHIGTSCSANVVFEGTNVAEGNTLTTAEGMYGGGIYTTAEWDTATWETPTVVNTFTNYNSNN